MCLYKGHKNIIQFHHSEKIAAIKNWLVLQDPDSFYLAIRQFKLESTL
jgi:hypothetical protein